jgi:hypothetical protein
LPARLQLQLRAVVAAMGMQHISTGLAGLQDEPDREDGGAYEEAYLVGAVGLRAEGAQGEQLEGPLEAALRRRGGGELAERAVGGVEQAVVRAQARVPGRGRERDDLQDGDMLAGASLADKRYECDWRCLQ